MTKEEILGQFERYFDPEERDAGYTMVKTLELARALYPTNGAVLKGIISEWLDEYEKPHIQHLGLRIIADLKIHDLMQKVYAFRREVPKYRQHPFLEYDLEVVDRTISALEGKGG